MPYNFRPPTTSGALAHDHRKYQMNNKVFHPVMSKTDAQLREILASRIMILDGAMGTIIQQYKLDETAYRGGPNGRSSRASSPAPSARPTAPPRSRRTSTIPASRGDLRRSAHRL
jgi:hypothetical protein